MHSLQEFAKSRGRTLVCGEIMHTDDGRTWICLEPKGTEHSHHDMRPDCKCREIHPESDAFEARIALAEST